jgi:hypothetical protein
MLDVTNYSETGKNAHTQRVMDDNGVRYMSYNTVIAFKRDDTTYISKKAWSPTTGRHKSYVKKYCKKWTELDHGTFKALYKTAFGDNYADNY